jgi:hypothetical protein
MGGQQVFSEFFFIFFSFLRLTRRPGRATMGHPPPPPQGGGGSKKDANLVLVQDRRLFIHHEVLTIYYKPFYP